MFFNVSLNIVHIIDEVCHIYIYILRDIFYSDFGWLIVFSCASLKINQYLTNLMRVRDLMLYSKSQMLHVCRNYN